MRSPGVTYRTILPTTNQPKKKTTEIIFKISLMFIYRNRRIFTLENIAPGKYTQNLLCL